MQVGDFGYIATAQVCIVYIPYHVLLDLVSGRAIIHSDLPDDTLLLEAREDFETRALKLLIYHPSFPVVADGTQVPRYPGTFYIIDKPLWEPLDASIRKA
jgi:hypothetical protein